ncbi:MAG: hypothetical protein OEZ02_09740 [Anaerolineae bacterium]|nr:hypothetical protein [Anaerolineae bacterium]
MKRLLLLLPLIIAACTASPLSDTPTLTAKPTSTPGKVSSPVSSQTLTATATMIPFPTITPFPIPTPYGWYGYALSPNGEWVAWKLCCRQGPYLLVQNIYNGKEWELTFDFGSINMDGGMDSILWSNDGRYLYYAVIPPGDGAFFNYIVELNRLDLANGRIVSILSFHLGTAYTYKFTSDETHMAYLTTSNSPPQLAIHEMGTGKESLVHIPSYMDYWAGGIVWSPDNSQLIFSIEGFDTGEDREYEAFNIVLVDLISLTSKVIVANYYGPICPHEWIDETRITLGDRCRPLSNNAFLLLDTNTGEIVPYEK